MSLANTSTQQSLLYNSGVHNAGFELWRDWKSSAAHNWTNKQMLHWLNRFVKLPQYQIAFEKCRISGRDMLKLATNMSFKAKVLGIADPIERKKLQLMALRVILFGTPYRDHMLKDCVLGFSIILALAGVFFSYKQNVKFKEDRSVALRLTKEMEKSIADIERLYAQKNIGSDPSSSSSKDSDYMKELDFGIRAHLEYLLYQTYNVEQKYIKHLQNSINDQNLVMKDKKNSQRKSESFFSILKNKTSFSKITNEVLTVRNDEVNSLLEESNDRWRKIKELCKIKNGFKCSKTADFNVENSLVKKILDGGLYLSDNDDFLGNSNLQVKRKYSAKLARN